MNNFIWKKIWEIPEPEEYLMDITEHKIKEIVKKAEEFNQIIKGCKSTTSSKWIWITISPNDIGLLEFVERVRKWVGKIFIKKYFYVFEQRSENKDCFEGLHCHLLVEHDARTDNVFRSIKDTFSGEYTYMKNCPVKFVDDKIKYMTEDKGGAKSAKQYVDKVMREHYHLQNSYTNMS